MIQRLVRKEQLMLPARIFSVDDQLRFSRVTGDANPIHVDPVAARRTLAGAPVVHGIHIILWLLETIVAHVPSLKPITALKAQFRKMLYVGDRVVPVIVSNDGLLLRAKAVVDGIDVTTVQVSFGAAAPEPFDFIDTAGSPLRPQEPMEPAVETLSELEGRLSFAAAPEEIAALFPCAAQAFGSSRLAALGCSTYLVGMVVPGLYSVFGSFAVIFDGGGSQDRDLRFRVKLVDRRFRTVWIDIKGGGLRGTLETFSRVPPTLQPKFADITPLVAPEEFKGTFAVIVGGSRGLGELTAKIVAAGGGKVVITYSKGASDAEAVAQEITEAGGSCEVNVFDATKPIKEQLSKLKIPPSHLYYYATPSIFRRKSQNFSIKIFDEFCNFYLRAFHALVDYLLNMHSSPLTVFYPSTVYVKERPPEFIEYAMAKAAGEVLCSELPTFYKNLSVLTERLPRLPTDQTASLVEMEAANAIDTILPIVRRVQGHCR